MLGVWGQNMQIRVNDQLMQVDSDLSIEQLLILLKSDIDGHAVAIKQDVISRQQWAHYKLQDNDVVSIFQAIAGG